MNHKKQLGKQIFSVSSFLIIAALFLTACSGAFSFQGSAKPNEQGGVDVSGGAQPVDPAAQPDAAAQPAASTGMDTTTILLIVVGVLALIVIIALVSRGSSRNAPPQ